jgi:polar amino acid transport system substrate-binding protein
VKRSAVFLVVLVLVAWPPLASAQALRVVGDSWAPYVDRNLPGNGLAVEIVEAGLVRAGYQPEFTVVQWTKALAGTKAGLYDVVAAIWYSDERNETLLFSEPFLENRVFLVKRRGSPVVFGNLSELGAYRVGVVRDFYYGPELEDLVALTIPSNYVVQMLLGVVSGSLDLAIVEERVALFEMNRYMSNQANDLEFVHPPVSVRGLRIAASRMYPEHAKVIEDFNAAIGDMRADGSFEAIYANYSFGQ